MFIFVVMLDKVLNSFTTATEYITFGHYVLPKLTLQCHRVLNSNYYSGQSGFNFTVTLQVFRNVRCNEGCSI